MANMSHCRFTNTLADLRDCYENMDGNLEEQGGMADEEKRARARLIKLCVDIASDYGDWEPEDA